MANQIPLSGATNAAGGFLIPDRPGHGMTLAPGAEKKYRQA